MTDIGSRVANTAVHGSKGSVKIEAKDVSLGYVLKKGKNFLPVSEHLNLSIKEGSFVAIVGRSGCGKSTFLHALQGLVKTDKGDLIVDGQPMSKPRQDHAVVFQDASLFPWRNTWRNITYGLEVQGRATPEALEYCRELVRIVGLEAFEESHPHELSGGMKQRVNLARALALNPSLLLLDEPFAALDAQTRQAMQLELVRIWQETEELSASPKTAVFITHDIAEAVFVADQVIILSNRPSRVRKVIDINLPKPRTAELKNSDEFAAQVDEIRQLLDELPKVTTPDLDW